jgi:hypothetical protein
MPTAAAPSQCQRPLRRAADERREERPEVDPHVEDRERAVAPRVVVAVELAHHHRHARLEVAGADDDEREPEHEDRQAERVRCERADARHGEHGVAERDHEAADDHRAVRAEQAIGDPAADDRRQVGESGVPAIEEARVAARPAAAGVHETVRVPGASTRSYTRF